MDKQEPFGTMKAAPEAGPGKGVAASRWRSPLLRAFLALAAAVLLAIYAIYAFTLVQPTGSPFWAKPGSYFPPLFSRGHDAAYAEHDHLPIGPRNQLFHRDQIEYWMSDPQPVPGLKREAGDNPWMISRDSESDIGLQRLFVSRDRKSLGAIGQDGQVYFYVNDAWRLEETRVRGELVGTGPTTQLAGQGASVVQANFSPDGTQILTVYENGTVGIWDLVSGTEIGFVEGPGVRVTSAAFSPDGTKILTTREGPAQIWDASSGAEIATLSGHKGIVWHAVFSPDGTEVLTGSEDGTVRVWDVESGSEVAVFLGPAPNVWDVEFSSDGTRVLTVFEDGTARIWDAASGSEIAVLGTNSETLRSAVFSPDGTRVLTAARENIVQKIWDSETGAVVAFLEGHERSVRSAVFSPDGTRVLTASLDGTARIWDAESGAEIVRLSGRSGPVDSAVFSPDGALALTMFADGTARIWDVVSGTEIIFLEARGGFFRSAGFSPNGSRIFSIPEDRTLLISQLQFEDDQSIFATALDASSGLIFGRERLQHVVGEQRINIPSFFPAPVNAVTEIDDDGTRLAVGKSGAIYLGLPAPETSNGPSEPGADVQQQSTAPSNVPQGGANDPNTSPATEDEANIGPRQEAQLGQAAGLIWYEILAPASNEPDLYAVRMSGRIGVAVGDGGSVKVSVDNGQTWRSASIEEEHNPNLTDVRLDGALGYGVAIGRPTFDEAPAHGVLYHSDVLLTGPADGQPEWRHVSWQAGAPIAAYIAAVLSLCAALAGLYFLRFWWLTREEKTAPVAAGKSDREIGWDDDDVLGLKQLALQVSLFLRNAQTEPPLVLGVAGGWGSGKSSLMNLLCQDLQSRGTSAVKFNAWHHQNEDHLLAALFEAVRTRAIPRFWTMRGLWFRARLIGPRLWNQLLRILPLLILIAIAVILSAMVITDEQIVELRRLSNDFFKSVKTDDGLTTTGLVVGAVPTLGLVLWLRSLWVALPAKPFKLLKDFSSLTRVSDFTDKLSFRYNFGRAFGEVCRALRIPGVPGLVIFIDDLDRCQATSVLSIFEAVNYFVSVGDCIVVMGFDRAQVEHAIGQELKDIADGIPDREIPFHFLDAKTGKRRAYARHYMEKLINLEVVIPPMTPEAAAAMAQAVEQRSIDVNEADERWLASVRPRIVQGLSVAYRAIQLLFVCGVGWAFWTFGGGLFEKVATVETRIQKGSDPAVPEDLGTEPTNPQNDQTVQTVEPGTTNIAPTPTPTSGDQLLTLPDRAPRPATPHWSYEELWILLPLVASLMLLAIWMYLRRAYVISKNVEYDPDTFVEALRDANAVIEGVNGTPRAVKRFMNRMRFASARMRQINYQVGPLDWLAQKMGWVSDEFEERAEGAPSISDRQVVALGTAEVFLQQFPDPAVNDAGPQDVIDEYVSLKGDDTRKAEEIGNDIKSLLAVANVRKETMRIYASTLHSSVVGSPEDDGDDQR